MYQFLEGMPSSCQRESLNTCLERVLNAQGALPQHNGLTSASALGRFFDYRTRAVRRLVHQIKGHC